MIHKRRYTLEEEGCKQVRRDGNDETQCSSGGLV